MMLPRELSELMPGAAVEADPSVAARDEEKLALRRERGGGDLPAKSQNPGLAHRAEAGTENVRSVLAGSELRSAQR